MNLKKYLVEELYAPGSWIYVGEFETTKEIADKIKHSPAKTNNFIKNEAVNGSFNRIPGTNFRVGIRN